MTATPSPCDSGERVGVRGGLPMDKLILVTRKTRLEALTELKTAWHPVGA